MGSLKSWVTIAILGGIVYMGYKHFNQREKNAEGEVSEAPLAPEWVHQPDVDMGAPAQMPSIDMAGQPASAYPTAPGYPPTSADPQALVPVDPQVAGAPNYPTATDPYGAAQPYPGGSAQPYPGGASPATPGDPAAASAAPYPPATAGTGDSPDFNAVMHHVQGMLDAGKLADAQLELSQWFDDPALTPSQQQELVDLLDQLTGTVVYSQEHHLAPPHSVRPGETLEQIAQQYQVPVQLLAKINGIDDPTRITAGQTLKVVPGPFSALVELSRYRLTLWLEGRYAGRFAIGVGRDANRPEGDFTVQKKNENPAYQGPDRMIAADDPSNPLGERWIELAAQFGIHGTNDPASIGRNESRGCIRLSPQDVEDVYDILTVGSRVRIHR